MKGLYVALVVGTLHFMVIIISGLSQQCKLYHNYKNHRIFGWQKKGDKFAQMIDVAITNITCAV